MINLLKNNLVKIFKLLLMLFCIILMQPSARADEKTNDAELQDGGILLIKKSRPRIPQLDISANIGYGFLLNRTPNLTGEDKKMEDDLSAGLTWDIRLHSYFKSFFGIGFMYSGYHSSAKYKGADVSADITYVAPLFCMHTGLGKTKLLFKSAVGIGYLGLREKALVGYGSPEILKGGTVGCNYTVGLEYRFCKHFGLGFDIDGIFGSIKTLKDSKGNKYEAENERLGVSRVNLFLGLRCYIK